MTLAELVDRLDQERHAARMVCDSEGAESPTCRAAWDAVEDLLYAKRHRREMEVSSPFERYCLEFPEAMECRIYD